MDVDNEYDISVRFRGKDRAYRIRTIPLNGKNQYMVLKIDNTIEVDVWQKYDLYFTLETSVNDKAGALNLSPEYEGKGIDPELVSEISTIIKNAEQ